MQSVSDALGTLHRDASWFARATEHRVMLVTVGGDLRAAALKVVMGIEVHADNRATWALFEDAFTAAEPSWASRTARLAKHWERLVEAFSADGVALPPLDASRFTADTAASFGMCLSEALSALRPPLEGIGLVLAPTVVDDPARVEQELLSLALRPELARARWVIVTDETAPPMTLLRDAPALRALATRCVVDPATLDRDLDAVVGPTGGVAAPPGVTPPRRVDDPPHLPREKRDEALRASGVDPAALDAMPDLRAKALGAAVAMKRGRGAEAVTLQREARDLAAAHGLHAVAVICQITLASYLSGLGDRASALVALDDAATNADAHGLPLQRAQAELARGMLLALDGRHPEAATAYARAGEAAQRAEAPSLAIEAWRLAGTIQMQFGDEEAARSLQRAIDLAEGAAPPLVKTSSAPEAARQLAGLYERRGISTAARSLHELADAMERGEVGTEAAS